MEEPNERTYRKNRKRFKSMFTPAQQKFGALTVVVLLVFVLISMVSTSATREISSQSKEGISRSGQVTTKIVSSAFEDPLDPLQQPLQNPTEETPQNGEQNIVQPQANCKILPARVPNHKIQSTFTASYPGSGAKMTWKLIEGITGLVTGDDFQLNGHENIVSIKTHYPSSEGRPLPGADSIPRAILLIRNPLYSIPSYFNFVYEFQNNLPGHSQRAPLNEWISWRNENFDQQLQVWQKHTEYWMDTYRHPNRIVVSYEDLTDDERGAEMALKITEFLRLSDGVRSRPDEDIPCIWHTIVKYKDLKPKVDGDGQPVLDQQSKRGGPKYIAPYTPAQLKAMMNMLTNLLERYRKDNGINSVLVSYIDEVARRAQGPSEDENTQVE